MRSIPMITHRLKFYLTDELQIDDISNNLVIEILYRIQYCLLAYNFDATFLPKRARETSVMADIFISYAREDRPRIEPIAKALEDQDWSVWWDPQIPPGKTFSGIIKAALDAAKCVVVLWSRHSIDSEWVFEEANMGKRRGILVPAKFDSVEPPLGFGLIQAADLTDWDGDTRHAEFEGFLTAISDTLRALPPPENGDQNANISESRLEEPPEMPHAEGEIPQSISRQASPVTVEPSESQADVMEAYEPKLTEAVVPEHHKTSSVTRFGIFSGIAVLLIAAIWWIWWWIPQLQEREVRQEKEKELIADRKGKETPPLDQTTNRWLRSEPRTVLSEEAHKTFGLDENGRPINYIQNHIKDRGKVVFDRATGLMWQKSGSKKPLTYEQAREFIEQLKREAFAGHSDWRLPTIPELMSLLIPQKQPNGLYTDPIFDTKQRWCWSADKGSSGSAWYVGFYDGLVHWGFLYSGLYVRAVRS